MIFHYFDKSIKKMILLKLKLSNTNRHNYSSLVCAFISLGQARAFMLLQMAITIANLNLKASPHTHAQTHAFH